MRQTILILVLTVFVNVGLKSQDYVPFPTENVRWNICLKDGTAPNSDTLVCRYFLQGDTTINNIQYNKLCVESGDTLNPAIEVVGGIREEGKKIFYSGKDFLGSTTVDDIILLYDFTKQIGDTIIHSTIDKRISIVLDIDSILIEDVYRKRYKVDNQWWYHNPDYIIEGIGSVKNGLLGHITELPESNGHYWEHICFKENGIVKYLNPTYNDCFPSNLYTSTGVVDIELELNFKIHPNPFTKEIHIENELNNHDLILKLIDINGKTIVDKRINGQMMDLDLNVNAGIYDALIIDKNGNILISKKIVKK